MRLAASGHWNPVPLGGQRDQAHGWGVCLEGVAVDGIGVSGSSDSRAGVYDASARTSAQSSGVFGDITKSSPG